MNIDIGLLVLRVGIGLMMLLGHGWHKLMHFQEMALTFPDPLHLGAKVSLSLAILAEVGCSILVILGFRTRAAVIPLIITMLVALIFVHTQDPWGVKERAVLYLLPYVVLFCAGSGRFSIEQWNIRR